MQMENRGLRGHMLKDFWRLIILTLPPQKYRLKREQISIPKSWECLSEPKVFFLMR